VKHLLFIITFQLFTFNLYAQSSETGVLYQFKSSAGLVWKTFGQDKVQPKYEGEVSNGAPDGFGVLSYPFSYGKSVVGEWKIGKEWYTEHYNKEGTLLGKYVKGEWILKWGVLFHHSKKDGIEGWYEDGDEKKDRKYVGDITNGKPNGRELRLHLKEKIMKVNGRMVKRRVKENSFKLMVQSMRGNG